MSKAIVFAATTDKAIYFKVGGRATFACCAEIREYAEKLLAGEFAEVGIDIEDCTGMDSTFMGILAMIGLDRLKKKLPQVTMIKGGSSNLRLLEELGLTRLFTFSDEPVSVDVEWFEIYPVTEDERPAVITLENGRLMLRAHQALMEAHEENVPKFKGVVDSLESELDDAEESKPDETN